MHGTSCGVFDDSDRHHPFSMRSNHRCHLSCTGALVSNHATFHHLVLNSECTKIIIRLLVDFLQHIGGWENGTRGRVARGRKASLSPIIFASEYQDALCAMLIYKEFVMYDRLWSSCWPIVLLLAGFSASQNVSTFCNRIFHSIIVANDMLYVDGGELRTVLP